MKALVTHDDLDAAGCAIVFNKVFSDDQLIYYCNVKKADEGILDVLQNHKEVDELFIADITPKLQSTLDAIGNSGIRTVLLDHHETAEKTFETMVVPENMHVEFSCNKQCGTMALYGYLCRMLGINGYSLVMDEFVEIVDDYDRFVLSSDKSIPMNQLFQLIGMDSFVKRGEDPYFSTEEQGMLEAVRLLNNSYFKETVEKLKYITLNDYNFAVVFSDTKLTSTLAKYMREQKISCDGLMVVNLNTSTISLRQISNDFHCGNFAKSMDSTGGGHAGAGGFSVTNDYFNELVYHLTFQSDVNKLQEGTL